MRWLDEYFPFTHPSLELEIFYQGDWMEVLGCGAVHPNVIANAGMNSRTTVGWAFGLGLERWAMKLFDIPDIRLFWSNDSRFSDQFSWDKGITKFQPFSKYPACYKDITFWVPDSYQDVDFFEEVRSIGGDIVESVVEIDRFEKQQRTSLCYRINYRSMERSLTNEEINEVQAKLRAAIPESLKVELR